MRSITLRQFCARMKSTNKYVALQALASLIERAPYMADGHTYHFAGINWEKDHVLLNCFEPEAGGVWHYTLRPTIAEALEWFRH